LVNNLFNLFNQDLLPSRSTKIFLIISENAELKARVNLRKQQREEVSISQLGVGGSEDDFYG
jgi:hypothetical protein